MFQVTQIQSEQFTSHVYVITTSSRDEVFLIDCGGFQPVLDFLGTEAKVKGIFLTHYHYDHIYYVKQWMEIFPNATVYGSESTLSGLRNPKINLSFYHEDPVQVELTFSQFLFEGSITEIFDGIYIKSLLTEGHCEGSITYILENYVFTGDALIPNIPTVTKLKTGSKELSKVSIKKIKDSLSVNSIICPGHLEMKLAGQVLWDLY
ncbi:MAG: hypothetical protein RL264_3125 [Bacteroidota bacterium]